MVYTWCPFWGYKKYIYIYIYTLLHMATGLPRLKAGVDKDAMDGVGMTPLIHAANAARMPQ